MRLAFVCLVLLGCQTASDDGMDDVDDVPCAVENVTGPVPGVSITITSSSCVYRRGESGRFLVRVTTDANVPAFDIPESTSCSCDHRSTQIGSWVSWVIAGTSTSGDAQQYCLCDTGCCAPQDATTVTPEIGAHEETIEWSGRTWQGPSDFGQEMGDFFAPGNYGVSVTFYGYQHGNVVATLPIHVIP